MDGPIEHCLSHCPWPTWATCEAIMDDMVGTWILEDFTVERGGETSHPLGNGPAGCFRVRRWTVVGMHTR